MKWLNIRTGGVSDTDKRPSKEHLVIVDVEYNDKYYQSTIKGIKDFSLDFDVPLSDIEDGGLTSYLEIFTVNDDIYDQLKHLFPYFDVTNYIDSDEFIEVSLPIGSYLNKTLANGDDTRFEPTASNTGDDKSQLPAPKPMGGGGSGGVPTEGEGDGEEEETMEVDDNEGW